MFQSINRNIGYDYMRLGSAFWVVFIHTAAYYTYGLTDTDFFVREQLLMLSNGAVPLFFMISGALLLHTKEPISITELFKKRISHIFVPFIVWSVLYILSRIAVGAENMSIKVFLSIWHEPAYYQFWFVYTLMALYVLLPLLQTWVIHSSKQQLNYSMIIWFITNVIIFQFRRFGVEWTISEHFNLVFLEGYLGYFVLGYYMRQYAPYNSKVYAVLAILGLISGSVIASFVWASGGIWNEYVSLPTVLLCVGIFGLFKCKEPSLKDRNINRYIVKASELTYGVYLVHLFVLVAIKYSNFATYTSATEMVLIASIAFILSLCICALIAQIKSLRFLLLGMKEK